jgi:hypothetical protein
VASQSALGWVAGMGMTFPKLDREFNCFGQICDDFYVSLVFLTPIKSGRFSFGTGITKSYR